MDGANAIEMPNRIRPIDAPPIHAVNGGRIVVRQFVGAPESDGVIVRAQLLSEFVDFRKHIRPPFPLFRLSIRCY
jgi:hypothetical protein